MELVLYGGMFLGSAAILYLSGEWVVRGLMHLSRHLGIREFVVAFFVMAAAASLPNLFVGLTSALSGVPELSLGDIFGNNLVAMTLAVAAGVLFSRRGSIETRGRTIHTSMLFAAAAAMLPVLLIADGELSRFDGVILMGLFLIYIYWLLGMSDRFSRTYKQSKPHDSALNRARRAIGDVLKVTAGVFLIIIAALGIVSSATFFADHFGVPLVLIGLLVVGFGGALPEVYFAIASARRGDTNLIMGNIIGAVILPATFVLGLVALIHPIHVNGSQFLVGSRIFLLAAGALFFIFSATSRRIGRVEAVILMLVYVAFLAFAYLTAESGGL